MDGAARREPTPSEAAVLSETVDQLFADLDEDERPVLELSLLGYTTREISAAARPSRADRVRLLREGITTSARGHAEGRRVRCW